jgi:two-component system, NtrC family, response regulator PilR
LFQAADGGTLFMDEIGNMNLAMQVKLYRVLQEGKVRPLGSNEELDVDVRVIAATNKDLEKAIAAGEFREDLFYRLSVIPIHVPSLRERREDIPLLARHFLEQFRKSMEKPVQGISPEAMGRLEAYDWPGNVRELENTIERAVALENGTEIGTKVLPDRVGAASAAVAASLGQADAIVIPEEGINFEEVVAETERRYLTAALEKAGGVRTQAAEILKISYRSFRHFAKKHNL